MTASPKVLIYTDGGCEPNPGRGGYGAVLIAANGQRREIFGGFAHTTNNRMEIYAALVALEALKVACEVTLTSDSKYLVDSMSLGWARKWRATGWKGKKNPDLWARMLDLCAKHKVTFCWVRGHAGHPENERCDRLANQGINLPWLPVDEGYAPMEGLLVNG